jgi:hypothetical protein
MAIQVRETATAPPAKNSRDLLTSFTGRLIQSSLVMALLLLKILTEKCLAEK